MARYSIPISHNRVATNAGLPTDRQIGRHTMERANRIAIRKEADGTMTARYMRTHKEIATTNTADNGWTAPATCKTATAKQEAYRTWATEHAEEYGVLWQPEYQAQSWERKYWKYETDEQVAEDAQTLMEWTIRTVCEKCKYHATVDKMELDSIVPQDSPLAYVEDGRYVKNGNWAVATVNLNVQCTIEGTPIEIVYPIEMRSGQLTKVKLTKAEIEQMIADNTEATA